MERYAFLALLVSILALLATVIGFLIEAYPRASRTVNVVIQIASDWNRRI